MNEKRVIRILAVSIVMIMLGATAAFAGGSKESGTSSSSGKVARINFLFRAGNRTQLFTKVTEVFNKSHPGIHVALIPSTGSEDLTTRIASGNYPDMTTQLNGRNLWPYVDAGLLMDLKNEPFIKKIYPAALAASTYKGGIYSIPMDDQGWGIFYNETLFAKAGISGPPETFDAFSADVEKLKNAGITPFAVGFATPWTIGQYFVYGTSPVFTTEAKAHWESFLKGDFNFANQPHIDNILKVFDLIINNTQPKPLDADISTQYATFASGKAAMMEQGSWSILQVRNLNPNLKMGIFPVPLTNNPNDLRFPMQYAFAIDIFKTTKEMAAIREYVNFFLDPNGPAGFYYKEIGVPSAIIADKAPIDPASSLMAKYVQEGKTVQTFQEIEPLGFNSEVFTIASGYIANHRGDHAWLLNELNTQFVKYTKQAQHIKTK